MSRNSNISSHKYLRTSLFSKSERRVLSRNSQFSHSSRGLDKQKEMTDEIENLEKERNSFKKKLNSDQLLQQQSKKPEDFKQLLTDKDDPQETIENHVKNKIRELHRRYKKEISNLKGQISTLEMSVESALKEKESYSYMYYREKEQSNALYCALRKKEDGYCINVTEKFRRKKESYKAAFHDAKNTEIEEKNQEIIRLNETIEKMTQQSLESLNDHHKYQKIVEETYKEYQDLVIHLENKLNFYEEKLDCLSGKVRDFESVQRVSNLSKRRHDGLEIKNQEITLLEKEIKDKKTQIKKLIQEKNDSKLYHEQDTSKRINEIQNSYEQKIYDMEDKICILTSELEKAHHELETFLQIPLKQKISKKDSFCEKNPKLALTHSIKILIQKFINLKDKLKNSIFKSSKLESNLAHKEELLQNEILKNSQSTMHLKEIQLAYETALSKTKLNSAYPANLSSEEEPDFKDNRSEMIEKLTDLLKNHQTLSKERESKDEKLQFLVAENFKLYETCQSLDKKFSEAKSLPQAELEHTKELLCGKEKLVEDLQLECGRLHIQVLEQSERIHLLNSEYENLLYENEDLLKAQNSNKNLGRAQLSDLLKQIQPLKTANDALRSEVESVLRNTVR